jgi:hypothetical protein
VFWIYLQLLSQTFLILRRIKRDIVTTIKTSSSKVHVILIIFYWNLNFPDIFSKQAKISNFFKIRPLGVELFHVDRWKDGYDEANSHLSQLCKGAEKLFLSPPTPELEAYFLPAACDSLFRKSFCPFGVRGLASPWWQDPLKKEIWIIARQLQQT